MAVQVATHPQIVDHGRHAFHGGLAYGVCELPQPTLGSNPVPPACARFGHDPKSASAITSPAESGLADWQLSASCTEFGFAPSGDLCPSGTGRRSRVESRPNMLGPAPVHNAALFPPFLRAWGRLRRAAQPFRENRRNEHAGTQDTEACRRLLRAVAEAMNNSPPNEGGLAWFHGNLLAADPPGRHSG